VPLICPRCSGDLEALPLDVVFACHECATGLELVGHDLVPLPLLTLRSAPEVAAGELSLPFWVLPAASIAPAFNSSRLLTLTRWYSERARAGTLTPHEGAARIVGGTLGSSDAARLPPLALPDEERAARRIAMKPDANPPDRPRAQRDSPSVLAIPFRVDGPRLVCAASGLHIYLETIEDARSILDRWGVASKAFPPVEPRPDGARTDGERSPRPMTR
jgi:hypothetical protein